MKIILEGSALYSGEVELDPYSLSWRERRRLKELTDLAGIDVMNALLKRDDDLYFALYVIRLERDKAVDVDLLMDEEGTRLTIDFSVEGDEQKDPKEQPPNGGDDSSVDSERNDSSGPASRNTSDETTAR